MQRYIVVLPVRFFFHFLFFFISYFSFYVLSESIVFAVVAVVCCCCRSVTDKSAISMTLNLCFCVYERIINMVVTGSHDVILVDLFANLVRPLKTEPTRFHLSRLG